MGFGRFLERFCKGDGMEKGKNMEENVNNIIDTAMNRLKQILDGNTIVGELIRVDETTSVLPVSKISVGFVAGGGEINTKDKKSQKLPFAGGSGSGFSVEPMGFLVFNSGECKYLTTQEFSPVSEVLKVSNNIVNKLIKDKNNYGEKVDN